MTSAIRGLMATPKKNIQISEDGRLTHDITTTDTTACHKAIAATIGAPELLPEVLVSLLTTPPAMEEGDNILQLEVDPPEEADSKAWAWVNVLPSSQRKRGLLAFGKMLGQWSFVVFFRAKYKENPKSNTLS